MTQNPLFARVALSMSGKTRRSSSQDLVPSDSTVGLLGWRDDVAETRNDTDSPGNHIAEGGRSPSGGPSSPGSFFAPRGQTATTTGKIDSKRRERGDSGTNLGNKQKYRISPLKQRRRRQQQSLAQTQMQPKPGRRRETNLPPRNEGFHDFHDFSLGSSTNTSWDSSYIGAAKPSRSNHGNGGIDHGSLFKNGSGFVNGPDSRTSFGPMSTSRSGEERLSFKSEKSSSSGRDVYKDGISRAFLAKQRSKFSSNGQQQHQQQEKAGMFQLSGAATGEVLNVFHPTAGQKPSSLDENGFFPSNDDDARLGNDFRSPFHKEDAFDDSQEVFTGKFANRLAPPGEFGTGDNFSRRLSGSTSVSGSAASASLLTGPKQLSPRKNMHRRDGSMSESTTSIDDLLAIKRELSDLKLWAKKKKVRGKKVQFSHPLITATNYRPRTEPEDIDKLFFNENELLDWEEDLETTPQEHVECTIEQNNSGVQVEVALLP